MKLSSVALLVLTIPTLTSAQFTCDQVTDCVHCLEQAALECVWTAGQCRPSCDIADAGCWEVSANVGKNEWEICRDAGEVACSDSTDCVYCLEGSDETCVWTAGQCLDSCEIADASCFTGETYEELDGYETCVEAGEVPGSYNPCNSFGACEPCLSSRLECVWIAGSCERDCDAVADAQCFSTEIWSDLLVPDICATAMEGVTGVSDSCTGRYDTCTDCLNNDDGDCAWIGGEGNGCFPSCDSVPDFTCYSHEVLEGRTTASICELAGEMPPCDTHVSCGACLEKGCAWIGAAGTDGASDACFDACSDAPDNTCYSPEVIDMSNSEICALTGSKSEEKPMDDEPVVQSDEPADSSSTLGLLVAFGATLMAAAV